MSHPITVVPDGRDVVCDHCGAVWAVGLPSVVAADRLATAMNTDPRTVVPVVYRPKDKAPGLCHDNDARIVVPELPPAEPDRPPLPVPALAALALALGVLRLPLVLARSFWRIVVVVGPFLVLVAVLDYLGASTAVVGTLSVIGVAVMVVIVLGVSAVVAREYAGQTPVRVEPEDGTVIRPVRLKDHHEG
jgi:hypothetical protein